MEGKIRKFFKMHVCIFEIFCNIINTMFGLFYYLMLLMIIGNHYSYRLDIFSLPNSNPNLLPEIFCGQSYLKIVSIALVAKPGNLISISKSYLVVEEKQFTQIVLWFSCTHCNTCAYTHTNTHTHARNTCTYTRTHTKLIIFLKKVSTLLRQQC